MSINDLITKLKAAELAGDMTELERLLRKLTNFAMKGEIWAVMLIEQLTEGKKFMRDDLMIMATIEDAQQKICDRLDQVKKLLVKILEKIERMNDGNRPVIIDEKTGEKNR